MNEDPRILDLRRRVQSDPASLAFAQLAEELRRIGANAEAVYTCRAGLAHHPDNLGARVTLGRALIELDKLDEAFTELTFVLDASPGNLPAIRALAEIYQRRGMMSEALVHYRRALQLAQPDTDLEHRAHAVKHAVEPQPKVSPGKIEELFDFDSLMAQLDPGRTAGADYVPLKKPPQSELDSVPVEPVGDDELAVMERQLREREERLVDERAAREAEAERRHLLVLQELEDWLAVILRDRQSQPTF